MDSTFYEFAQWQQYLINLNRAQRGAEQSDARPADLYAQVVAQTGDDIAEFFRKASASDREKYPGENTVLQYRNALGGSSIVYQKSRNLLVDWFESKSHSAVYKGQFHDVISGKLKRVEMLDPLTLSLLPNRSYDVFKMSFHGHNHASRELVAFGKLDFQSQTIQSIWLLKLISTPNVVHLAEGRLYRDDGELRLEVEMTTDGTNRKRKSVISEELDFPEQNKYRWGIVHGYTPASNAPFNGRQVSTKFCLVLREDDDGEKYFDNSLLRPSFISIEGSPEAIISNALSSNDVLEGYNANFFKADSNGEARYEILSRIFYELRGSSSEGNIYPGLLFLDGREDARVLSESRSVSK